MNTQLTHQTPTQVAPPEEFLAHSESHNVFNDLEAHTSKYLLWLKKILAAALILQGFYQLYQSIYFVFAKIPILESQIALEAISTGQVYGLAFKGVSEITSTIISILLALRLHRSNDETAEKIDMILSFLFITINMTFIGFFNQLESDFSLSEIQPLFMDYISSTLHTILTLIPFL